MTTRVANDKEPGEAHGHTAFSVSGAVEVAIIVVTFLNESDIDSLVESLRPETQDQSIRVVIADNASTDKTVARVKRYSDVVLVETGGNLGYSAGINRAIEAAGEAEFLFILNPDAKVMRGCIRKLRERMVLTGAGLVVPAIATPEGQLAPSLRREPTVTRRAGDALFGRFWRSRPSFLSEDVRAYEDYTTPHQIDWATGAAVLISREASRLVGAWDEAFFLYSEETDYFKRARDLGLEVWFEPAAKFVHSEAGSGRSPELVALTVVNKVRYIEKHRPTTALAHRVILALHELRRWQKPEHRIARTILLRRSSWESLPHGDSDVLPPRHVGPRRSTRAPRPSHAAAASGEHVNHGGFIWFAAQDWWYHNQAHSDFQLMKEVSRNQPVLVVNSLGLRVPAPSVTTSASRRILRKLKSMTRLLRRPIDELPNYFVYTPIMLPVYGSNGFLFRLNALIIRAQVLVAARFAGLSPNPAIGVTIPTAWPVVAKMKHSTLLFNRSDLQSAFPEANGEWVASLEHELLAHSDHVLYVSHELMRRDEPTVGTRSFFLDHGVDLDHFSADGKEHPEMRDIPQPRVGFFGGLDDYVVDMELLAETARQLPEVSLVLIGDATCPMDELTTIKNVHWLGFRNYDEIPALGRGFDVAIMPWLNNEWIRYANPIKLKEYLALGLPVVSTEYPEVDYYREQVLVAPDRSGFVRLIGEALAAPGDAAARNAFVRPFSWAGRASALLTLLERP